MTVIRPYIPSWQSLERRDGAGGLLGTEFPINVFSIKPMQLTKERTTAAGPYNSDDWQSLVSLSFDTEVDTLAFVEGIAWFQAYASGWGNRGARMKIDLDSTQVGKDAIHQIGYTSWFALTYRAQGFSILPAGSHTLEMFWSNNQVDNDLYFSVGPTYRDFAKVTVICLELT